MTGLASTFAASERRRLESVRDVISSPGQPLSRAVRQVMEPRFSYDFSRVRVHADAAAARSGRDIGASAYTIGNDIVFGDGQFAPGSPAAPHRAASCCLPRARPCRTGSRAHRRNGG
jgi:Domain of unknown function (DUF4157)